MRRHGCTGNHENQRTVEPVSGDDISLASVLLGGAAAVAWTILLGPDPEHVSGSFEIIGLFVVSGVILVISTILSALIERELRIYWRIRNAALEKKSDTSETAEGDPQ